jgi:hypothetical protein
VLLVYVAGLVMLARQDSISHLLVELVAVTNVGWGIGCIALLLGDWTDANALGVGFILLQVIAVLAFAALQMVKLRQAAAGTARMVQNAR